MGTASVLECAGCGRRVEPVTAEPYPFRCRAARAGDDIDHVIGRRLDPEAVDFPHDPDENPFRRYRPLLHSWQTATACGMRDAEFLAIVEQLDREVARVDGRGFRETPFFDAAGLGARLGFAGAGALFVKDETDNVAGSHKGRHLAGVMLHILAVERLGLVPVRPRLAIASCGNAALAAAVLARAANLPLQVFVPPDAEDDVLQRLRSLGASVVTCHRAPGIPGDPCYHRFREAVDEGALPFSCQGSENGLAIEGGKTLVWEIIDALGVLELDHLFIQVGGGALASACLQAYAEARSLGRVSRIPSVHLVQTAGAFPLKRAFDTAVRLGAGHGDLGAAMRRARCHRSSFMWPWETEPRSVARGILDDEAYDWAACVEGMLGTGGVPLVVDDAALEAANGLARKTTRIPVDHTGTAGLAGLSTILASHPHLRGMRCAVIFSGTQRKF